MTKIETKLFHLQSQNESHSHDFQVNELDENECRENILNHHSSALANTLIKVENLFKTVMDSSGQLDILKDIHFDVMPEETIAIIGASGSGKSTLLSLLAGLDTPTQGTIYFKDQNLFELNEDQRAAVRAQNMGFVFQSFQLMSSLTALENVMLPLELANQREARQTASAILERVGLSKRLNHYPKVLSGGEQQRVALARAFVMKPAVLLADEPTGSLDFATGQAIMELMFELNREQATTLILVTHDAQIAKRCKRQITIESGQIRKDYRQSL